MTLDEIKVYLEIFNHWKQSIALIYGKAYADKYCNWERFHDHLEIIKELEGGQEE